MNRMAGLKRKRLATTRWRGVLEVSEGLLGQLVVFLAPVLPIFGTFILTAGLPVRVVVRVALICMIVIVCLFVGPLKVRHADLLPSRLTSWCATTVWMFRLSKVVIETRGPRAVVSLSGKEMPFRRHLLFRSS